MGASWKIFGVPVGGLPFGDTRTITSAVDYLRANVDPYSDAALDHFGQHFNYPPAWLLLERTGITQEGSSNAIGIFLIASAFSCFLILFRPSTTYSRMATFFAILSPPVLLALERGNCDVILFSIAVWGFYFTARLSDIPRKILHAALVTLLTVLKIYPIAAAIGTIRRRRDFATSAAIVVFALAVLLGTSFHELLAVFRYTPTPVGLSFGNLPGLIEMSERGWFGLPTDLTKLRIIADCATVIVALAAIVCTVRANRRAQRPFPTFGPREPIDNVALACLAVFCLAFCFGSNWAYRLIFLLGVLPPLIRANDERGSAGARIAIGAIIALLWLSRVSARAALIFEPLTWVVFAGAAGWIGVTLWERSFGRGGASSPAVLEQQRQPG